MKNNKKIWIIDDDTIYTYIVKRLLHQTIPELNNATTFTDSRKAFTEILRNTDNAEKLPDIILLDLMMPMMDGYDFLDELENVYDQLSKKPKVSVITTSLNPQDEEQVNQHKIVDQFFIKPLTEKTIKKAVNATN